jgi:hypothetical protein
MMQAAKFKHLARGADGGGAAISESFMRFVQAAKLNKPELEGELADWNKGKVSDSEMMLGIEKMIKEGGADAVSHT